MNKEEKIGIEKFSKEGATKLIKFMQEHPEVSWRANDIKGGGLERGYFVAGTVIGGIAMRGLLPVKEWKELDYHRISTFNLAPEG